MKVLKITAALLMAVGVSGAHAALTPTSDCSNRPQGNRFENPAGARHTVASLLGQNQNDQNAQAPAGSSNATRARR